MSAPPAKPRAHVMCTLQAQSALTTGELVSISGPASSVRVDAPFERVGATRQALAIVFDRDNLDSLGREALDNPVRTLKHFPQVSAAVVGNSPAAMRILGKLAGPREQALDLLL